MSLRTPQQRPGASLAFAIADRDRVVDLLSGERFSDVAPTVVFGIPVDENFSHRSIRTMYRRVAGDRRNRRIQYFYVRPTLLAVRPNDGWSWGVTKLKDLAKWGCFYLCWIVGIFTGYAVGGIVSHRQPAGRGVGVGATKSTALGWLGVMTMLPTFLRCSWSVVRKSIRDARHVTGMAFPIIAASTTLAQVLALSDASSGVIERPVSLHLTLSATFAVVVGAIVSLSFESGCLAAPFSLLLCVMLGADSPSIRYTIGLVVLVLAFPSLTLRLPRLA